MGPLCERYIEDPDSFRNLTKELKYLDLDYNQFRHLPSAEADEYAGIEKGYEHFMYEESPPAEVADYGYIQDSSDMVSVLQKISPEDISSKPSRGRGKVKASYYDSDSDYDSGGFQKLKSNYSDSDDSEDYRNRSLLKGKPKPMLRADEEWSYKRVDGKPPKSVSSKDRRKRLRIDETIESVIARITKPVDKSDDTSGTNQSSTNDDTTEESDTLLEDSSCEETKPKLDPDVMIIATKAPNIPSPPKPNLPKSITTVRAHLMKRFNVPNSLRRFRKPSADPPIIPYSRKPAGQDVRFPLQAKPPRCAQPRYIGNHKPRSTQLIAAIPRYPPAKSKTSSAGLGLPNQVHKPLPQDNKVFPKVEEDDDDIMIEDIKIVNRGSKSQIKTESFIKTSIKAEVNQASSPIKSSPASPLTADSDKLVSTLINSVERIKAGSVTHYRKSGIVVSSPDCYQLPSTEDTKIPYKSVRKYYNKASPPRSIIPPQTIVTSAPSRVSDASLKNSSNSASQKSGSKPLQKPTGRWQHSGCLYMPPTPLCRSVQCTFKTRDGRIIPLLPPDVIGSSDRNNPRRYNNSSSNSTSNNSNTHINNKSKSYKYSIDSQVTCEALSKYLSKQEENGSLASTKNLLKNSSVTITRKAIPVQSTLDKRKGFSNESNNRQPLASAQKNVLNSIMHQGNGLSDINPAMRPPIRAMPVTHTTPNIVLDKSSGLSRVLPKGTTVVRKNRTETSGAGPSGLNNGGSSTGGNIIRPRVAASVGRAASSGPTRFLAQNVIHSSNQSLNQASSSQLYFSSSIASSSNLNTPSSLSNRNINHQSSTVMSPTSSTILVNNSSNQARLLSHDASRDGIILSSGIGNQVFTHSANTANREVFITSNDSRDSSNSIAVVSSSGRNASNTPTIASLLNSSPAEMSNQSSSNIIPTASSNTPVAASNATPAPLGYATLVGGALSINSTLGGAPGRDNTSTPSTVATLPRGEFTASVGSEDETAGATRLGSIISGGGLLGRVLAASGVSGVRLLGGSGATSAIVETSNAVNSSKAVVSSVPSMLESLLRDNPVKRSVNSHTSVSRSNSSPASSAAPYSSVVVNVCTAPINSSGSSVIVSSGRVSPASPISSSSVYRDSDGTETITLSSGTSLNPLASSSHGPPASPSNTATASTSQDPATSAAPSIIVSGGSSTIMVSGGGVAGGSILINSGANNVAGNVILTSGSSSSNGVLLSANSSAGGSGEGSSAGVQQVLVPAHLVQVQTSDGSTGLGLVHSGPLGISLPACTRVVKPGGGSLSGAVTSTTSSTTASGPRQVSLLQNVKILQNRQIVRTVVMQNSMALQGIGAGHQGTQIVAISGSQGEGQQQFKVAAHKGTNRGIGPCNLVIRAVRPPSSQPITLDASGPGTVFQERGSEGERPIRVRAPTDEGLAERLSRHYLKTVGQLNASTAVQSVGTQTQTTAVKNTAGQLVSRVVMNNLSGTATVSSLPTTSVLSVTSSNTSQNPAMSSLPLASTNVVSSETLEQLREFESVFEKVSNKSTKDEEEVIPKTEPFPATLPAASTSTSSEESLIAAQLLSMANDAPARTTQSYVYSLPSGSASSSAYITIPNTSQPSTLILVNPGANSSSISGASPSQQQQQQQQPPPSASPALSTTSSHSSIASSPSSTPSKKKPPTPKPKVVVNQGVCSAGPSPSNSSAVVVNNPKTPPPPKAPPKPQVAKPQVEDTDEIRAKIKLILDNYKMLLAETPQQQPAPRNRKNCPPSRNDSKSGGKKKSSSTGKKVDGSTTNSPIASDPGTSASPSPGTLSTPTSSNMLGESSGVNDAATSSATLSFQSSNDNSSSSSAIPVVEEPKVVRNEAVPNVVVSTMKHDNTTTSTGGLTQTIGAGSRIFIRTVNKVGAISTRQSYYKNKPGSASGNQSGPPPNVTIQGRINMSDLVESHLASLLNSNQQAAVISKKIDGGSGAANSGGGVQQVLLQTQSGQLIQASQITGMQQGSLGSNANSAQVIQTIGNGQQVVHSGSGALVQIPSGQQVIQTASGQLVHVGGSGVLASGAQVIPGGATSQATSSNSVGGVVQALLQGGAVMQSGNRPTGSGTQVVQQGATSIQPTQQMVVQQQMAGNNENSSSVIKQACSAPAVDASLRTDVTSGGEESNGSEHSDSITLPPFFTLAKSFLTTAPGADKKQSEDSDSIFCASGGGSTGENAPGSPSNADDMQQQLHSKRARLIPANGTASSSIRTNSLDSLKSDLSKYDFLSSDKNC